MSNLLLRTLTGALYVALVLASFLHPIAFVALFGSFTAALLWEFCNLTGLYQGAPLKKTFFACGGCYLFVATGAIAHGWAGTTLLLPYILFLLVLLITSLYDKQTSAEGLQQSTHAFFAQAYCAGFLSLLHFNDILPFVLALFTIIWVNDTAAFLTGVTIGRRPLFPRLSPKKTWEGLCGGGLAAIAVSQAFAACYPTMNPYQWLGLALVIVAFGTWGDLLESLLKRTCHAKDSGTLLPGHGGLLDRLDSILLATPATYIYLQLIAMFNN